MKLPSPRSIILIVGGAALLVGVFVWWNLFCSLGVWLSTVPPNRESPSTTIRNFGLVVGGVIAIAVAIWRSIVANRQAETSERGLLNERYQKGAEMLGSEFLFVRVGGIYALQRLAEEHAEQYHVQIMRLFCTFVCHPTEDKDDTAIFSTKLDRIREDVQAAMTAIGTRSDADIILEDKEEFRRDLDGAMLPGAILHKANLSFTSLRNTKLSRAILPGAILHKADLTGANLTAAKLFGANLTDADLFGANLTNADLTDAKLTGAKLSRANLTDAALAEANLTNAGLFGANLTGADLTDATLTDATLAEANLTNAKLLDANLTNAKLFGANLTAAKLLGANLTYANLLGADLTDANLAGANLFGADLTDATLTGSKLFKAKGFTQAQLNKACADPQRPPELQDVFDAKTGVLLAWEQSASP